MTRRPALLNLTLALACVVACAPSLRAAPSVDAETIINDVDAIATGGNPASLVVWSDATPLVVAPDGRIFCAAGELGRGRVVGLGHGGFAENTKADTPRLIANAIVYLADGASPIRLFADPDLPALELLESDGIKVELILGNAADARFDEIDVVVGSPQQFAGAGALDGLETFIRGGGGMLALETAWGQLQLKRADSLETLACNTLFADAGLMWTGRSNSPIRDGVYPVDRDALELANAERALRAMTNPGAISADEKALAVRVIGEALGVVPLDSELVRRADAVASRARDRLVADYRQMVDKPLTPQRTPLARALIDLESRRAMELDPRRMRAHPSHLAFPGALRAQSNARVRSTFVRADPEPGWITTGVWVPAGEAVSVRIDDELVDAGLVAQVGAWRDPQNFDQRVRMKHALRRFDMDKELTFVASPIGGPLYIDVPDGFEGELNVTINSGVLQPHFHLGETSEKEWNALRDSPGPWAEVESQQVVLTIPAEAVADLDHATMTKICEHWDRVADAMEAMEPRTHNHWPRPRKYRYVAEKKLSWGYMYCPADGPLVIPTSAARAMATLDHFDNVGPNELWGHYHEMGHGHQNSMWTFGGTGEVTVNIFTVRALHEVNGYPLDSDVMRSNPTTAWETFESHKADGAPFDRWKSKPFLALQTYSMLWHEFGFESFDNVFDAYRALPQGERPRSDDQERDMFMVMFSREVGRNLGPYFQAWGIPIGEPALAEVADLPDWVPQAPEGFGDDDNDEPKRRGVTP